jgi:hypothetical protein
LFLESIDIWRRQQPNWPVLLFVYHNAFLFVNSLSSINTYRPSEFPGVSRD